MRTHLAVPVLESFVLVLAAALPAARAETNQPPNILFIMADDLGWGDVGFAGASFFETAHIDKLASRGKVFTAAYSGGPNCSPSRACLMSGTYTPRHQIYTPGGKAKGPTAYMKLLVPAVERTDKKLIAKAKSQFSVTNQLDPKFVCIPEVLKPAGYKTARLGKWHLGANTQGFDLSSTSGAPGDNGNYYGDIDVAEKLTDRALKFIEDNREGPFLLYLSHWDVHSPHHARKDVVAKYQAKLEAIPADQRRNFDPVYAGMIEAVDESVGRVVAKIDELGLGENTLIVFTSDNGGLFRLSQLSPLRGEKGSLFEAGVRVPCAMRWTGTIQPGTQCETPITSVDFLPTFASLAKAELPQSQPVDGVDISPLLIGEKIKTRSIFWHFPLYLGGQGLKIELPGGRTHSWRGFPCTSVRRGDYKLIEFFETNTVALYNLKDDPGEAKDLAAAMPELAAKLRAEIDAWQAATKAPVPTTPNPEYDLTAKRKGVKVFADDGESSVDGYTELLKLVPAENRIAGDVSVATLSSTSKSLGKREAFWRTIPRPDLSMASPKSQAKNLREIPEFLRDLPLYRDLEPGDRRMILGDTLSTVRLLGGWAPLKWLREDLASYDLVYRGAEGNFGYRWDLLHQRLRPFIECGVQPFIVLDNVPYAFIEKPTIGKYGQVMGPDLKYMEDWGTFIRELAKELVRAYGREKVETWRFRIGTEPDLPGHWKDTTAKWCMMYDHAAHGVRSVLPKAQIGPGNFLAPGVNRNQQMGIDIMNHLAHGRNYATGEIGSPVSFVSGSIYAAPKGESYQDLYWSSHPDKVRLAAHRLKQLRSVDPAFATLPIEFHEFGNLLTDLSKDQESRRCGWAGTRGAAWTHQAYAAALDEGIEQIFTWHNEDTLNRPSGELFALHGAGWVRAMLENFTGGDWYLMQIQTAAKNKTTIRAMASVKKDVTWVSISTFDLMRQNAPEKVRLVIHPEMLPGGGNKELHVVEYLQTRQNAAYDVMHADLKARGELQFDNDAVYRLDRLANENGKSFLQNNWKKYDDLQNASLRGTPWKGTIQPDGANLVLERRLPVPAVVVIAIRR